MELFGFIEHEDRSVPHQRQARAAICDAVSLLVQRQGPTQLRLVLLCIPLRYWDYHCLPRYSPGTSLFSTTNLRYTLVFLGMQAAQASLDFAM